MEHLQKVFQHGTVRDRGVYVSLVRACLPINRLMDLFKKKHNMMVNNAKFKLLAKQQKNVIMGKLLQHERNNTHWAVICLQK